MRAAKQHFIEQNASTYRHKSNTEPLASQASVANDLISRILPRSIRRAERHDAERQ